jgi:hypothetical protein
MTLSLAKIVLALTGRQAGHGKSRPASHPAGRGAYDGPLWRLFFFVAYRRPLPVNPLHLFGKHQPTARHFFKCSFYGRICCFCRALLGLGRFLSVDVRTQRHTRQTPDR